MGEERSLGREFLGFVPLFLLHVSIGMMGSFTTILIHYFEHTHPQMGDYTTILGHTHLLLFINTYTCSFREEVLSGALEATMRHKRLKAT